jgi:hypothetical protein
MRGLTVSVHVLLLSTFLLSRPASAQSPIGEWRSNGGGSIERSFAFVAQSDGTIRGDYDPSDQGRIIGRVQGQRLIGFWHEASSNQRCKYLRNGTYYWGRIIATFSADWKTFAAMWSYCDEEPLRGEWDGRRIAAAAPRLLRLRYMKFEDERFVEISGDLKHGSTFYVEATFDANPAQQEYKVRLSWQAGANTDITVKPTSDAKVFRSEAIHLQPPVKR